MAARRGKDAIEDILIAAPQGAAKGSQHGFDLIQLLRDGADGFSHMESKQGRLDNPRLEVFDRK